MTMKIELKINNSSKESASYIGWAPARCSIRLPNNAKEVVRLTLRNTFREGGGRIVFLAAPNKQVPRTHELRVKLQKDQPTTFFIAGYYPHSSTEDRDTAIAVFEDGCGSPVLEKALMVRVRKNANEITKGERDRLVRAFHLLRTRPARGTYREPTPPDERKPVSLLDELVLMHSEDAAREIHNRGCFHPWHRIFLLHVERELQKIDPSVSLVFWKFDEKAENVFHQDFVGETALKEKQDCEDETKMEVEVKFSKNHPWRIHRWHTVWGPLYRNYLHKGYNPAESPMRNVATEAEVLSKSDHFTQWRDFEEYYSHNPAHGGFGGLVSDIGKDPADPLFHLLHTNVDRLWARWQKIHHRFDPDNDKTYPFKRDVRRDFNYDRVKIGRFNAKNLQVGNFLYDSLWPWDWDFTHPRPNHDLQVKGTSKARVQPNIRLRLPESPAVSAPGPSPLVLHTIDFQGEIDPTANIGVAYQDVPYFEEIGLPERRADEAAKDYQLEKQVVAFDGSRSVKERLEALQELSWIHDQFQDLARKSLEPLETQASDDPEAILSFRQHVLSLLPLNEEGELDLVLKIMQDDSEDVSLRTLAIQRFRASKRWSDFYVSRQPKFFAALRGLIGAASRPLRLEAMEVLAANGDEYVQRKLKEELGKSHPERIAKEDAIFLLSLDVHGDHAPQLRELLVNDASDSVRAAAALALATDTEAEDLLRETVESAETSAEVRTASLSALFIQNPKEATATAMGLVTQESKREAAVQGEDEVEVQTSLMNVLFHNSELWPEGREESLKSALGNFQSSPELVEASVADDSVAMLREDDSVAVLRELINDVQSMMPNSE